MTTLMPESETCVVCRVAASTADLTLTGFPGDEFRWVCRDFHACARNVAAAQDLRARRPLHDDLDARHGPGASVRHLELRRVRMRALIAETEES